jgi:aspartate-semialdehyde dehydrogenase
MHTPTNTLTRSLARSLTHILSGYWVDAASSLRMKDDAVIILDPVNRHVIDQGDDNL